MLLDNLVARKAASNERVLSELLTEIKEETGTLRGTGATEKQLQDLMKKLQPESPEKGRGRGKLGELAYRIVIDCTNEQHQADLLSRFEKEGLKHRALIS